MRNLYLLKGPQGSGKSTLIKDAGLEDNTLSFDTFRRLFGTRRTALDAGSSLSVSVRDGADQEAVKACMKAAEARMSVGDTLIIDNMNLDATAQKPWKKLADKYAYTLTIVDVAGDIDDVTLLSRNTHRGAKKVDEGIVIKAAAKARSSDTIANVETIPATELTKHISRNAHELTMMSAADYGKVVIIGDVHGHIDALNTVIDHHGSLDDPNILWVFVGDLFDRGPDSGKVFARIFPYIHAPNVRIVEGNHETNLLRVLNHSTSFRMPDTRTSRDQILAEGFYHNDMTALIKSTTPALRIENMPDGKDTVVTHAGVIYPETILSRIAYGPVTEAVLGTSARADVYKGASTYSSGVDDVLDEFSTVRQFHGHRSAENDAVVHGKVYNLETGVTRGGMLSSAAVDSRGVEIYQVEVEMFEGAVTTDPVEVAAQGIRARMEANDNVRVKDLGNGLVSCNFTRDAFRSASWDAETVRARGLFLDGDTVVGRGYDKFFAVGERGGFSETDLDRFEFPARSARKVNGFLGIAFVYNSELMFYTKSGPSNYAVRGMDILRAVAGDRLTALTKILQGTNTSALFEVIATDDPHIVDEGGEDTVWLLDVVRNDINFQHDDTVADHIVRAVPGIERAPSKTISTVAELHAELDSAASSLTDEGCVVRDAGGRMVKVKADNYAMIKQHRTALNRALKGDASKLRQMNTPLSRAVLESGIDLGLYSYVPIGGQARAVHLPKLVAALEDRVLI